MQLLDAVATQRAATSDAAAATVHLEVAALRASCASLESARSDAVIAGTLAAESAAAERVKAVRASEEVMRPVPPNL
jgi:hypothetical protein